LSQSFCESISEIKELKNNELTKSKDSTTKHHGKGRPYSGNVDTSDGREDYVKEKRAIFRAFKQFLKLFTNRKVNKGDITRVSRWLKNLEE
jgi:hypothetical protein